MITRSLLRVSTSKHKAHDGKPACNTVEQRRWDFWLVCGLAGSARNRLFEAKPSRDLLFLNLWASNLRMPEIEKVC